MQMAVDGKDGRGAREEITPVQPLRIMHMLPLAIIIPCGDSVQCGILIERDKGTGCISTIFSLGGGGGPDRVQVGTSRSLG